MKKKIVVMLFLLVVLVFFTYAAMAVNAPKHPSDYRIGITYEKAMSENLPVLAVFYADWCGYCMRFMPRFKGLSNVYKDYFNFVMINVESTAENQQLAQDYAIGGYPTVYIIDPKYDNRILLSNTIYHDMTRFRAELDRFLRIRNLLDAK